MGVDIYMRWKGFGKEDMENPNYKNQITGFQDNGKYGYLRIGYGYTNYKEAVSPFFWNWNKPFKFTEEQISRFIKLIKAMKKEDKKEYLDFAKLGIKLNKEKKNPKVVISY